MRVPKLKRTGLAFIVLLFLATGCQRSSSNRVPSPTVRLPNGQTLTVEILTRPEDLARGMMFRDPLPENHGLLFVHPQPGRYPYWMYQVRVPLDIIWLDQNGRIVEMALNCQPCPGPPENCPRYGGRSVSKYVLELNAGSAQRYSLQIGDQITF